MRRRLLVPLGALAALAFPATAAAHAGGPAVFTLANQTSGNRVLAFARAHDGSLSPAGSASTGGAGPASVTAGHGRVYVVNAGGLNVVGFRVTGHGLRRIPGGSVALASGDAGPAQVSLNPAGTA